MLLKCQPWVPFPPALFTTLSTAAYLSLMRIRLSSPLGAGIMGIASVLPCLFLTRA